MTTTNTTQKELLPCPCPFCECDYPRYQYRKSSSAVNGHHFIRCPLCHTEGPRSLLGETDAVGKWNDRAKGMADIRLDAINRLEDRLVAWRICATKAMQYAKLGRDDFKPHFDQLVYDFSGLLATSPAHETAAVSVEANKNPFDRRTPPAEQPAEVTHGGVEGLKVVVTCNMAGQCVCVSRQDPEGRIHEVIWEAEQPAEGMKDAVKWRSRAYRLSQIKVGENDEDYWARIDADNVSTSIESHLASKREQPVVAKMETTEPTPDQRRIEAMRGKIKALCPELRDIGRDDLADKCIEIAGDMAYVPTLSKPAPAQELPEPFGYFKADIDGWRDCSETEEGARPLYEASQLIQATAALQKQIVQLCNNWTNTESLLSSANVELTILHARAKRDAKLRPYAAMPMAARTSSK